MTARRVFWLLLVLVVVGAYHYRRSGLEIINFSYRLGKLHWQKEFVAELPVHGSRILVYTEKNPDQPIQFKNFDQFQIILKKAFNDHAAFLMKYYPEIYYNNPKKIHSYPKKQLLTIFFVLPDTYQSINTSPQKNTAGFYLELLETIYFQTGQNSYSILKMESTIRHEIFHYLSRYYQIADGFEEAAAQRFGDLRQ